MLAKLFVLQSQDNQPAVLKNLLKEVCSRLQEQVSGCPEALLQKSMFMQTLFVSFRTRDTNVTFLSHSSVIDHFISEILYVHKTIS
jgi:hypothetical protein